MRSKFTPYIIILFSTFIHNHLFPREISAPSVREIVILCSLDGKITAFDLINGELLWSIGTGKRPSAPQTFYSKWFRLKGRYRLISSHDGSLYVSRISENTFSQARKSLFTVQSLVENSPLVADGYHIIGSKKSSFLSIDPTDGEVVYFTKPERPTSPVKSHVFNSFDRKHGVSTIKISKATFDLKIIDPDSSTADWNTSVSEYRLHSDSCDLHPLPKYRIFSQSNGIVVLVDHSGEVVWSIRLNSPAVHAFGLLRGGHGDIELQIESRREFDNPFTHKKSVVPYNYTSCKAHDATVSFQKNLALAGLGAVGLREDEASEAVDRFENALQSFLPGKSLLSTSKCSLGSFDVLEYQRGHYDKSGLESKAKILIVLLSTTIICFLIFAVSFFYIGSKKTPVVENSEIHTVEPFAKKKFIVNYNKILGKGSNGTLVYDGFFEGRKAAIKRLLKGCLEGEAQREIDMLLDLDEHPNVLRYFARDEDDHFVYLALEMCKGNLADVFREENIGNKKTEMDELLFKMQNMNFVKKFIKSIFDGVKYLHSKNIVHRDLKPENILISRSDNPKVADMGLSKKLKTNQNTFETNASGSAGWQPPEVINDGKHTYAIDIFSLGCVLYYILAGGHHPFGDDPVQRAINLRAGELVSLSDFSSTKLIPGSLGNTLVPSIEGQLPMEAQHLMENMLVADPKNRIKIDDSLRHPFFWDNEKRLSFLCSFSNRFEKEPHSSPLMEALESRAPDVVGRNWGERVGDEVLSNLGQYRRYNFASLRDLLRVVRNKAFHYTELPSELRDRLGDYPSGYYAFFADRFPRVLVFIYLVAGCLCAHEKVFSPFFGDCSEEYLQLLRANVGKRETKRWYPIIKRID